MVGPSTDHHQIRNHYGKYEANKTKNQELLDAADEADMKRRDGKPMGEPPEMLKKRIEELASLPPPPPSRLGLPSAEPSEADSSPSITDRLRSEPKGVFPYHSL
jgi:hypothetical protein